MSEIQQYPKAFPFPLYTPPQEFEQYFCVTERHPTKPYLLLWMQDEGMDEPAWCTWDGDLYLPTEEKVTAFWLHPGQGTQQPIAHDHA